MKFKNNFLKHKYTKKQKRKRMSIEHRLKQINANLRAVSISLKQEETKITH